MKAVIVGGGIGGLATALALALDGIEVEVLERTSAFQEVGAGIQISPNGMHVLDHLGVTPLIEEDLFEPPSIEMRGGRSGRSIFKLKMKGYAQRTWNNRFIQIHRADLHAALQARLREVAGHVIKARVEVTGYVRERGGASVYVDGSERLFGDIVIGADGIGSSIRSQMLGLDRARFTGNVAWRITVPVDQLGGLALPEGGCIWAGAGKHAVTTRIRGGTMANFVGVVEQQDWQEEGWTIPGSQAQALADFGDWSPVLRAIIESSDDLYRWALHDRPPLTQWSDGAVALVGDAAHPMLPSMAQGAVQALEDAVILARCLRGVQKVKDGLMQYQTMRQGRTAKIQARSAANLQMFHRAGFASQLVTWGPVWIAGQIAPPVIHRKQHWIYGYNPIV